jgi:hypothetical protein
VIAVSTTTILNVVNVVETLGSNLPRGILMLPAIALENAMACRVFRHLKSALQKESSSSANAGVRPPLIPLVIRAGLSIPHPPEGAYAPHLVAPVDDAVESDARSSTNEGLDVNFPQGAKLSPMRSV